MKKVMLALAVSVLLAASVEAAKERGNRTKCSAKLEAIAAQGIEDMEHTASVLLPVVMKLSERGNDVAAAQVAVNAVRRVDHRGHVTVLKLHETADTCVGQMERDGADAEEIEAIRALERDLVAGVERARIRTDSFFDIWT